MNIVRWIVIGLFAFRLLMIGYRVPCDHCGQKSSFDAASIYARVLAAAVYAFGIAFVYQSMEQ